MQTGLDGYKGWLDGDREAFAQTVAAYNKKLIYYIGSMVKDFPDAEDIASEVFLRLLLKKPSIGSEEQLGAWLYKTARNLAIDLQRKSRFSSDGELPETADEEELIEAVVKNENKKQLHAALSRLNPDYREVLILLYFGELSYAQAAKVMKKNEAQIRNLAFRARQSLKEQLERMGFTYEN